VPTKLARPPEYDARYEAWRKINSSASAYRSAYLNKKLPQEDFDQLESIGFAWCRHEWKWENEIVPGLLAFKKVHGDLELPNKFVVPLGDEWPEKLLGMKLGVIVQHIRTSKAHVGEDLERKQWLDDNGFVWDEFERRWQDRVKPSLLFYKQQHGDMEVPARFTVPSIAPWPKKLWGTKLGKTVDSIRSTEHYVRDSPERKQWLQTEGFRFIAADVARPKNDQRWETEVKPALVSYKKAYSDLQVPFDFVVPSGGEWPEELEGMKLGKTVRDIRSSKYYVRDDPERKQWLDDNGFVWDETERRWQELVQPALSMYKQEHGNMHVPRSFVVPSAEPWPEKLWGLKLGVTLNKIRSKGDFVSDSPERRQWLDGEGFAWEMAPSNPERVRLAAAHYGRRRVGASTNGTATE
jgi:hypothetical protein